MSDSGKVKIDPLFVGLTRPAMFLGVSTSFAVMNLFGCMVYFIQTSDLSVVIFGTFVHMIGYIICFKEPLFMELFLIRGQKCSHCKNKMYYGANSYDIY